MREKANYIEHLKQLSADEKKDPVAQKFLALAADAAVTKLKLTDQAIDRAHRRKLLGNPPCSPDKYSVVENVATQRGARTMTLDPKTHRLFSVTAEFGPTPAPTAERPRPRPPMVPGTFTLLVLEK